jgi:hypothetical protein
MYQINILERRLVEGWVQYFFLITLTSRLFSRTLNVQ